MRFTKVEGCGNHFILLDQTAQDIKYDELSSSLVEQLCDTHFGIGADGVLCVRLVECRESRYEMVVHNADGSLAEMCGNGLRCVVRYLHLHHGLCAQPGVSAMILTGAGPLEVMLDDRDRVGVKMGWPERITPLVSEERNLPRGLLSCYSLGNPHLVTLEPSHFARRKEIAPLWEQSVQGGINISFAQQRSAHHIDLHVYERGCGWTLGCGTGACATVYHGYTQGLFQIDSTITVTLPGGDLSIDITAEGLMMWGEAYEVYRGTYLRTKRLSQS